MKQKKPTKKKATNVGAFLADLSALDKKLWVPFIAVVISTLFISQTNGTVFGVNIDPFEKPLIHSAPVSVPDPALYPMKTTDVAAPSISAESAIVMDVASQVILYQKNQDVTFLPASTTKIMTALVGMDHFALSDVLTVPPLTVTGAKMKLAQGEIITFENLLYGLLLASGNDAAVTIAYNAGGIDNFISAMNEKSHALRLINTYFADPTGLSVEDYTTALDLARLASFALTNETLAKIVATKYITVSDVSGAFIHSLENLNKLLGVVEGANGIKTGFTEQAGQVLVAAATRDGHTIVTVVLRSEDRFLDSQNLLEWAFANHTFTSATAL